MSPASKPAALRRHLAPRQKVWLNWDGVFLMGPNYLRFLAAVEKTGTIRAGGTTGLNVYPAAGISA